MNQTPREDLGAPEPRLVLTAVTRIQYAESFAPPAARLSRNRHKSERYSEHMPPLDLKKQFAEIYKPSAKAPSIVDVPPLRFLMLDGEGDVGGPTYQDAVQTLYGLAYPVKFEAKKRLDLIYAVMPLQALYWDPENPDARVTPVDVHALAWRLMLMLPDPVPAEFVDEVRAKVAAKKSLPRLDDVRVQTFSEGKAVQMLHLGPYTEETTTVQSILAHARERGFEVTGRHHEIYLNDPQKTAPAKLKTILRYGVGRRR